MREGAVPLLARTGPVCSLQPDTDTRFASHPTQQAHRISLNVETRVDRLEDDLLTSVI